MNETRTEPKERANLLSVLLAGVAALALSAVPAQADYGYSYFRTVEGYADLRTAGEGGRDLRVSGRRPSRSDGRDPLAGAHW